MTTWPGHAVLQVPVPVLEPAVRARYLRDDPSLLALDPRHIHAHVTVLAPVPAQPTAAQIAALRRGFARVGEFDVTLGGVDVFANGIIHVTVSGATGMARLTAAAMAALPGHSPYGGAFEVCPHVTVDSTMTGATRAGVAAELADLLPVTVRAQCVELVWYRAREVAVLRRFPLP